jgi:hypothetical protein
MPPESDGNTGDQEKQCNPEQVYCSYFFESIYDLVPPILLYKK